MLKIIALLALLNTELFILPQGAYTHQVVIEYSDGGPPVMGANGERRSTLLYKQGPFKKADCDTALKAVLGWFTEAEEQLNANEDRVKLIGGRCEAIGP